MPIRTFMVLVLACAACADHAGSFTPDTTPPPPVNKPDSRAVDRHARGGPGETTALPAPTPPNKNPPGGGKTSGTAPVPEPGTLLLVGSGLAAAALMRRRRNAAQRAG